MQELLNRAIEILEGDLKILSKICFYMTLDEERKPVLVDAEIEHKNNKISLTFDKKSLNEIYRKNSGSFFRLFKKSDYRIKLARIGNLPVELIREETVEFNSVHRQNNKVLFSAGLDSLKYMLKDGNFPKNVYRLSESGNILMPYLGKFDVAGDVVVGISPDVVKGTFNGKVFYATHNEEHVYIQYDGNIDDLLLVLSFCFCRAIHYDKHLASAEDGAKVSVKCPPTGYLGKKENDVLMYLFSKEKCLNNPYNLLDAIAFKEIIPDVRTFIEYYVRCESIDEIARLIVYCSILEKMAGVKNESDCSSFSQIKKFLEEEYQIDADKINDEVSKHNILKSDGDRINNFYELRNQFVHHLGSNKAEEFLKESDMLFFLKEAITIVILEKLGVESVCFEHYFHDLSVFNDKVVEFDYFGRLLNEHW